MNALTLVLVVVVVVLAVVAVRQRRELRAARRLVGALPHQRLTLALRRLVGATVHRDALDAALYSREALINACPFPVLVLDPERTVSRANAAARAVFGPPVTGVPIDEVSSEIAAVVDEALAFGATVRHELVDAAAGRTWTVEVRSHPSGVSRAAVCALIDESEHVDFRDARRTFSAAVSHELRTPLQRIRGLVETLGLPLGDGEREEVVQSVEIEVDRMRELIDEMLLLATLDRRAGGPLAEIWSDAGEIAREVVDERERRGLPRGMQLSVRATPELSVPMGARLLEVVLGNLVDNALRHAGRPATVDVLARGRAGLVEVVVRDDGVGIAREHLPHVMERFFRADASRSTPGTGLGLAVVKHVVEAHGGQVTMQSHEGYGTEVRVVLPQTSLVPDG